MADEKLVRVHNLRALLKARHVEERDRARHLADRLGSNISYWSGMLAGARSFGEKVARRIEEGLDLPRGSLDLVDWTPTQHPSEGVGAHTVAQELRHPEPDDESPKHPWEFILSVPASDLPKRFRAAMPDDALAPDTPRGLVLHFSTEAYPVIGHGVLVQDAAGGRHVRRYAQGLGGAWRAEARNTAYMTLHSGDGVQLLAVVTGRDSGEV